jgi:propanediol dehydratase large subunit
MKVGLAIRPLLTADSAVQAMISGRVYPEQAPEGAQAPFIVYSIVSNSPSDSKNGTPIDEAQVEVFSINTTYANTNDLADKVRAALDRANITVNIAEGSVVVDSIKYTNEVTEVNTEKKLYVAIQDYTIRIRR